MVLPKQKAMVVSFRKGLCAGHNKALGDGKERIVVVLQVKSREKTSFTKQSPRSLDRIGAGR